MRKYRIKEYVYSNGGGDPIRKYGVQSRTWLLTWEYYSHHATLQQARDTLSMLNASRAHYD